MNLRHGHNRAITCSSTRLALVCILVACLSSTVLPARSVHPAPHRPDGPASASGTTAAQTSSTHETTGSRTAAVNPSFGSATTTTLAELQARIVEVLQRSELTPAIVGIKVASLDTGKVLFEENGSKLLRPASNMKLYTVAAALDRLTPEFQFTTSVYAPRQPDRTGVISGDLTIYGRGDPSIAARFNDKDYFKAIDDLAARIAAAGAKRIKGDLVGDESYFTRPRYGSGWTWEDLQWWYGAEISALTVNDNALDLFIKPGLKVGSAAVITTGPPDPLLRILNRTTTGPRGSKRSLYVYRGLSADEMEVAGSVPLGDNGYSGSIGISHPALLFVYLLRAALAKHGVTVTGKSRVVPAANPAANDIDPGPPMSDRPRSTQVVIAARQSPPLGVIAAHTLKPSQNLYTELILRTLGKQLAPPLLPTNTFRTSDEAGLEVVKAFLREAGVNSDALELTDGSGLSRNDMVTAEATLQLLTYMSRHRFASAFREALPIAGVDGTLRSRFKGTAAENNLRAKTGTLSSAASLSGYVTTAAGENLVFSIMVNNYPESVDARAACIDPIAVLLASFAGRS
jgi:serine-type D-Ala-D-Ala carboxypeptidase/endopeptidase (penicillin-binding protein 4)